MATMATAMAMATMAMATWDEEDDDGDDDDGDDGDGDGDDGDGDLPALRCYSAAAPRPECNASSASRGPPLRATAIGHPGLRYSLQSPPAMASSWW